MEIKPQFKVADILCGAGGGTEGAHQSDSCTVVQGLNHSEVAIATNKANHPYVSFLRGDLYKTPNSAIMPCDIAVAGIECTNHSNAKGGTSRDADSRAMANEMFRYVTVTKCGVLIIENVREFKDWGPLIPKRNKHGVIIKEKRGKNKGKAKMIPDPSKKGQYFYKWKYKMMNDYGFVNYSERILCAADFGVPTIRTRLFIIFAKADWNISWPLPTHSKTPDLRGLKPWVPCRDFIDLNNHGKSIFGRTRKDGTPSPLVEKTLARIAYGIKKELKKNQFIMKYYGSNGNTSSIHDPLHTITTKDRHALITTDQFYVQNYHNSNSSGSINDPLQAILTKDEKAFITIEKMQFIDKYFGPKHNVSGIDEPLGTVKTQGNGSLTTVNFIMDDFGRNSAIRSTDRPMTAITSFGKRKISVELIQFVAKHFGGNHSSSSNDPLGTITTKDHNALVSLHIGNGVYLLDIKMRWLTPRELANCQGFPPDYILMGNQAEQKKGIGNSIPPGFIKAILNSMSQANLHKLTA